MVQFRKAVSSSEEDAWRTRKPLQRNGFGPASFLSTKDISDYFVQTFSMYLGEEAKVELLCENALMGSIIDRFGENVAVQVVDREHFKVTATIALSNNFYGWVFASGGKMRILEPEKATAQFQAILDNFLV